MERLFSPPKPPRSGGTQEGVLLEQKWNHMFQKLLEYRQKYGNCLVPNRWKEGKTFLGAWVSTQRRQYKLLLSGGCESSTMTPERATRLESIGFAWETNDPRHVPWDIRYQQLLEYKSKYGDCVVPIGYKKNVKLANWVSTQRQEYKLLIRGRTSRLSSERIAKLNAAGFVWEAQRGGPRRNIGLDDDEDATPDKSQIASKHGPGKTCGSSKKDACVVNPSHKNTKRPSAPLPPDATAIHPPQKRSRSSDDGTKAVPTNKLQEEINWTAAQQDGFFSQSTQHIDQKPTLNASALGEVARNSRRSAPPSNANETSAGVFSDSSSFNQYSSLLCGSLPPDKIQSLLGLHTMSRERNSVGSTMSMYPPNGPLRWPSFSAQDMGNAMRMAEVEHHAALSQGFLMTGNDIRNLEILKAHEELSGILNHIALKQKSRVDHQALARQQSLLVPYKSNVLASSIGRGSITTYDVDQGHSSIDAERLTLPCIARNSPVPIATPDALQETLNNKSSAHSMTIHVAGGVFDDAEEDDIDVIPKFRKL